MLPGVYSNFDQLVSMGIILTSLQTKYFGPVSVLFGLYHLTKRKMAAPGRISFPVFQNISKNANFGHNNLDLDILGTR